MINRFSSRRTNLGESFLNAKLQGAIAYDRIAGYFRSSILEVAGEALESIQGTIRVICNSDVSLQDVETARAANYAQRREWCNSQPEKYGYLAQPRFARLYEFLKSGKMKVKVLPGEKFGLVHGKAGVITLSTGEKTAFMGSANETYEAWKLHYELVWEDDSAEAVNWVQEEFDSLWQSPHAVNLAEFVIEDVGRLARRKVIPSVEVWRDEPNPAAAIIETPVYRQEFGLWEHQKYFVKLAFDAHLTSSGARYILADQVGLGKTMQLALAALLMALYGNNPVLILVPKPLLWQWQEEMKTLLDMPSAVWTGKRWVDEQGIEYPIEGTQGIKNCPRRVGIVSQSLITSQSESAERLLGLTYECVIVDEAHRARRKNFRDGQEKEKPKPNNLLDFLQKIAKKTKSLLLATATPIQLHAVEAWDLLDVLATNNDFILGNTWSPWRYPDKAVEAALGQLSLPENDVELWSWVRNPLPTSQEKRDFQILRRSLRLDDGEAIAPPDAWQKLNPPDRKRLQDLRKTFGTHHNPFIRHIVRRTRQYLENTLDPETNEPYLKAVRVELLGEKREDAIGLPLYLEDAYNIAEEFCQLLSKRLKSAGFLKTLLLRRVGSTIYSGLLTAKKLLSPWDLEEEEEEETDQVTDKLDLTLDERELLKSFVENLEANKEQDPKYQVILNLLFGRHWLDRGCIIFSQYYDSIWWLANQLSQEFTTEPIGLYAGGTKSGIIRGGQFTPRYREDLKQMVRGGELRLILGTDAASEGLNLQRLGTLINLDLPWNPTRLEQRKGRIQRIGQLQDVVYVYNMRYLGSVEDRVHELLSERLEMIHQMFGQIPDVLEDVWIDIATGENNKAKETIDAIPQQHPFEFRYHQLGKVNWESCTQILEQSEKHKHLLQGW